MMYRHEDYEEAVDFISQGRIKTAPLITHHFPFGQYLDAYKFIEKNNDKAIKVMIDVVEN